LYVIGLLEPSDDGSLVVVVLAVPVGAERGFAAVVVEPVKPPRLKPVEVVVVAAAAWPPRTFELCKLKLDDEPLVAPKPPKPVPSVVVGAEEVIPVELVVEVAPRPLGAVEEADSDVLAPKFKPVEAAPPGAPPKPNNELVLVFVEFEPKLKAIFACLFTNFLKCSTIL